MLPNLMSYSHLTKKVNEKCCDMSDHFANPVPWLSPDNLILTEKDREIVLLREELGDKHINLVQAR